MHSPSPLGGGGTRVFEARLKSEDGKLIKNSEPVMLKVSWRDCDREREDKILEQIFADSRKKRWIEKEGEPRKYLFSVFAEGNVIVDGKIDGTNSPLRGSNPLANCAYPLPNPPPVDDLPKPKPTRTSDGLTPNFPCVSDSTKQSKVCHRTHSDLVFQEACQPIYGPRSLDTLLVTSQDARTALQFLRSVDWVYHDVSTGNVLPTGRICESADLKYTKHMDSDTEHELRTGTLGFMACEVEAQNYLFGLPKEIDMDMLDQVPFRFNPLHDVESIWWIATWILYYHVDQEGDQRPPDQTEYLHKLFPGRLNERFIAFSAFKKFRALPTSFHRAAHVVANMCVDLKGAYSASESGELPDYTEPLAKLHSVFIEDFKSVVEHSAGIRLFSPTVKHPH